MGKNDVRLKVCIIGATRIGAPDKDQGAPQPVVGAKPRQILGMLAARAGEPLSKEALAERLWDGSPPRSYVASLESYVCVLRRQLRTGGTGRGGPVATASRGYVLDPDLVEVDAEVVRSTVETALDAEPAEMVRAIRGALAGGGRLLASEPYAPWAEDERRSFDALMLRSGVRAAAAAHRLGDHESAVELADRVLQLDPLTEAAWLVRMRSLAATSQRLEALRCYAAMESVLRDELGVEPQEEARAFCMSLLASTKGSQEEAGQAVRALLGLLRRTLEQVPGLDVPVEDAQLSAVAARLIRAA